MLSICYLGGTIKSSEQFRFKTLLFRATRGKAYVVFYPIMVYKHDLLKRDKSIEDQCVYLVFFEDGPYLRDRVTKICGSFMGSVFEVDTANIQDQVENA